MSTRKVQKLPARKVRNISRQTVYNPSGGMNSNGSPNLISDKEWSDLLNVQFDEGGVVRKRNGTETYCATLTSAYGLGSLITDSIRHLLTIDGTNMKYTSSGTSWTQVTSINFTAGNDVSFTQARGKVYIWNGVDGGAEWDGSTLARLGTMPKATCSVFFSSYHIASGVTGQSSRVYISELANSSAFTRAATMLNNTTEVPGATVFTGTTANYIDIQPNDGDRIIGLGVFQDMVIVFKENSIYQLTIDATGNASVSLITRATGCTSPRSIVNVENDIYFMSREGIRILGNEANYYGTIRTSLISQNIEDQIRDIPPANYSKINAAYYDNEFIITVPASSGELTYTYSYNRIFKAWSKWSNINARSMATFIDSNNKKYLYYLKSAGTQVYRFMPYTYSDSGTAIDSYILSKVFDFKNPDITKYFVDLGLMFRTISGEVTVEVYTEGNYLFGGAVGISGTATAEGMGYGMLGEFMLGITGAEVDSLMPYSDLIKRIVINTNSTTIRFKISNNRVGENFVFLGYIHAFYPYGHYLFDSDNKVYL